jgi:ADP-ribose pyrophosphatase
MKKWKKLEEAYAYKGWRKIIRKRFELPDGRQADFDILGAGHYITVAALTEDHQFLLVRQYRPGPETTLVSFPEGGIDDGETPEEAARRELLEETGYSAGKVIGLKTFRSSYTNQLQFCLLATGCRKTNTPQPDEDEFLEVFCVDAHQLRGLLRNTEDDSFSSVDCGYLALDYLGKL